MPMFEPSVAMTTSQHPRRAALPAKQRPLRDADERHEPGQAPEEVEGQAVEARHAGAVGVARAAAAALGEEHDRQPLPLGHLEEAVLLAVVLQALGAGQDRVVVGHHHDRAGPPRCRARRSSRRPGVRSMRSWSSRRRRWAAITSGPYSTRLPGSRRSSTFSRAVRWPVRRRRSTASGRAASSPIVVAGAHLGEVGPLPRRGRSPPVVGRRRRLPRRQHGEHVARLHHVARRPRAPRRPCPPRARRRCAPSSSTR